MLAESVYLDREARRALQRASEAEGETRSRTAAEIIREGLRKGGYLAIPGAIAVAWAYAPFAVALALRSALMA